MPDSQKDLIIELALDYPELSPRELAFKMTDELGLYFGIECISNIKTTRLNISSNHILISAANEFKDKTNFVHQMWQTDF